MVTAGATGDVALTEKPTAVARTTRQKSSRGFSRREISILATTSGQFELGRPASRLRQHLLHRRSSRPISADHQGIITGQYSQSRECSARVGFGPFAVDHLRPVGRYEHTELCWLLSSVTQYGELRRMTQFKDKAGGKDEQVSAALLFYPVLQAADILLYDTNKVPVGEDQKQHIELTRDIAARFNARYGETFTLPQPDIKTAGARVMSLEDPTRKMSKSDTNPNAPSRSPMTPTPSVARSGGPSLIPEARSAAPDKPALTNLLTIYSLLSGEPIPAIEASLRGTGVWRFKSDLAEVVISSLAPIQARLADLNDDPDVARAILGMAPTVPARGQPSK